MARARMNKSSPPSYLGIGIFILALALVSYVVRIILPIGKEVVLIPPEFHIFHSWFGLR